MTEHREFRELVDPDEAAAAIADLPIEPGVERVPLREARGRVLAERVDAGIDVPGFDRASLDGYAVRAADTAGADEADPARLDVVGAVHAGEAPDVSVGAGEAVAISTGAPMPDGADAMVPIERIDEVERDGAAGGDGGAASGGAAGADEILVRTAVAPGGNVMPAGADVAAGQRALGPGTPVTAREVGLLAALGVDDVPVRGRPTVGVLSTGEELVPPGEKLDHARGEIHDVNTEAIAAAVADSGGEPRVYDRAGDDREALAERLREAAAECDLLLTSGSTSAGAVDVLYDVLEAEGEVRLHGVALKPGKPTLVGRLGETGYVGLPGYPVSAAMVFRTLVAPAIREAAGEPEPEAARTEAVLAEEARFEAGRRRLLPVGLVERGPDGTAAGEAGATGEEGLIAGEEVGTADEGVVTADVPLASPVDRGSGATTSLTRADGLVTVPAETAYVGAGERVSVELFATGVRPPTLLAIGEDDPGAGLVLDRLDRPRYLPDGTDAGVRRLRAGVPDVAVVAGPLRREVDATEIAAWTREWGLVVPAGNPDDVAGLAALVDEDLRLANLASGSGLRRALDRQLTNGEAERVDGYGVGLRGSESPARRVLAGEADAGLGLRATAERLDLGFVPVGEQRVRLLANPERTAKRGVAALGGLGAELDDVLAELPGYGAR